MYLPKINKKIASYLLGGGVAITLATVGGLKLQNSTNYQAQVEKYAKVKARFATEMKDGMQGWYLPTWQNDSIWKRQHENYLSGKVKKEEFKKQFPTPTSFRDHCYRHAQHSSFSQCTASEGWCMECGRAPHWEAEENFK